MLCSKCQKNIEPNWFQCENYGNNFVNISFEAKYKKAFEEVCKEIIYFNNDNLNLIIFINNKFYQINETNFSKETKILINEYFKNECKKLFHPDLYEKISQSISS